MKILKLGQKQRKKLLKLCEEFFPTNGEHEMVGNDHVAIYPSNTNIGIYPTFIHWYQLIFTELDKRITNKVKKSIKKDSDYFNFLDYYLTERLKEHPVDVLWEYVQDCKKNKYFKK